MRYHRDIFFGVKTADLMIAKSACELIIGRPLRCTNSTFYGGDHCHSSHDEASFDLRLNHHDDGDGWSWCVQNPLYPLVLQCSFFSPTAHEKFLLKIAGNTLVEMPRQS